MSQCFVCDKHLKRCDINDEFSREDFAITVRKIIGDDYLLLFGEDDHLCRACQNLSLRIIRLENEEKNNTLAMAVLLQDKYSLDVSNKQSQDNDKEPRVTVLQSDHELEHCFVCEKLLQSCDFNTGYSRKDLIHVIRKIFGARCYTVIKEEDHLCQACQDLLQTIRIKGEELRTMTLAMRALLRIKYSLDFQTVGTLGSSLEDSSVSTLEMPVIILKDKPASSPKRPSKKSCPTKSAINTNALSVEEPKKDLTPSTPEKEVLKKIKKNSGGSSLETVLNNLNSTQSLVSKDLEVDSTVKNSHNKEDSVAALQGNCQLKTEDSANQNCPSSLQDDSLKESHVCESESICTESKTKISFHISSSKKCLKRKTLKPLKCGRCKFKYSTPEQLEAHNLEMKSKKHLYCNICDFNFHLKHLMSQHNLSHSPMNLMLQCRLCHQPIYDRLHLRYHTYTVHGGKPDLLKCSHCNRSFLWKRQLTRHLYKYHEARPAFVCDKCKKVFADKVKYLKHVEYFHRNSFSCKVCLKSYKNIDCLSLHERTHQQIPIYKCQYCYKRYRILENCKLHEEQHSGNFEYKCDRCKLGFQDLVLFEKHKTKNTCVRSFYDYINRPTMCEICGKIFSNRNSFKNHHMLHFNPQPFECNICFKKLRYKQKLKLHMKRYHHERLPSTTTNESAQS